MKIVKISLIVVDAKSFENCLLTKVKTIRLYKFIIMIFNIINNNSYNNNNK